MALESEGEARGIAVDEESLLLCEWSGVVCCPACRCRRAGYAEKGAGGPVYLVERGVQLAELADRLDPGAIGRCEFVVVSGPAGSGRSALLAASSESARKRGMRVLPVGRDGYGGTPRVDVVGAAGELVRSITGDVPAEDLGALAKQLLALTRSAPLLVVVDDVHLIDPDSYTLLRALVSAYGAETAPIAVLVSGTRHAAACQLLKELFPFFRRRRSRPIVTTPLTTVGMAELVRMRLSVEPSAVLVEELAAVTGGNVFLIQAVLDDTVAAGVTDSLVFGPVFTQAVLFGLHAPACPQLVEVAQAISVLGASCDMERLSRTVEEPRGLHRMVDGLIASGVLSDELTLHPRIRDVLLKSADGTRLPMLQSRAAEVLYDDGAPAPEVARQLLMNGSAPQPWAVAILCEAADQATRSYRYQEAVSLLQFASRWCSDHATRVEIRANLVDISWWLDPTMVSRQLRSLLDSARKGCLSSKWLARLARRLAWLGSVDEVEEVFGLALDSPHEDLATRIELAISDFWIAHLFPGAARHAPHRGSDELAPEMFVGDFPWLSSARELPALLVAGKQDGVQLRAEEILQQCRPNHTNLEAAQVALFSLLAAGLPDAVRPWLADLTPEHGDDTVLPQWRSMLYVAEGVGRLWQGDLPGAVESVERALRLLDTQQWGALAGLPRGIMLMAMTEQGRHQEVADELLRPIPPSFARSPYGLVYLRARGRHHLATGGLQAALADFRSCRDILASWGMELPGLVPWRLDLSETLLLLGQQDEARLLAEEHLSLLPEVPLRARGTALRLRAMASPLSHRAAGLREAVTVLERCGDALELPRALGALARAYQQTGKLAYGRRTLRRAKRLAERSDGVWALREISAATVSSRTPPELIALPTEYPDLSVAEGRVAELAAQGYTNREIADALYVTVSTVEQHLTHIYRKMKIRGRSELGSLVSSL
ncbi:AAA family ATPase [Streptomyces antimycoticus]|uniref:helix-turn-helix transcriptional regulator n=1 Tax=Streptomyces antimycoticus TaxID=68175 RepID=UPI0033C3F2CB